MMTMKDFLAMNQEIRLLIQHEYVSEIIAELLTIESIEIALQDKILSEVEGGTFIDENKEHPFYSLNIVELTTIIISVTGLFTSLVSLASVILDFKSKLKAKSGKKENSTEPHIVINNYILDISKSSSPEELAQFIEDNLKKTSKDGDNTTTVHQSLKRSSRPTGKKRQNSNKKKLP